ncbi:hypothetical protein I3760_13G118100 [Carya illinoinensis]|nr:hypothetical protein I3760_13G118100 [Carya illinoinensis]
MILSAFRHCTLAYGLRESHGNSSLCPLFLAPETEQLSFLLASAGCSPATLALQSCTTALLLDAAQIDHPYTAISLCLFLSIFSAAQPCHPQHPQLLYSRHHSQPNASTHSTTRQPFQFPLHCFSTSVFLPLK